MSVAHRPPAGGRWRGQGGSSEEIALRVVRVDEAFAVAVVDASEPAIDVIRVLNPTLLICASVTSGNSAIQGLVSQVDAVTKDGSAFEMSRADF